VRIKPKRPPILIAIVGGSGSGKSWLADKLQDFLGERASRLSQDDFYRDRSDVLEARRGKINFDVPSAIDWLALENVLKTSLAGKPVRYQAYDFKTHTRSTKWLKLPRAEIILIDGLWLLRRPSLRKLFALKIFLDAPTSLRFQRRLQRDILFRGRTPESVRKQFRTTVQPMHQKFVAPQNRFGDVVLKRPPNLLKIRNLAARIKTLIAHR
jgi:uridine kinase